MWKLRRFFSFENSEEFLEQLSGRSARLPLVCTPWRRQGAFSMDESQFCLSLWSVTHVTDYYEANHTYIS